MRRIILSMLVMLVTGAFPALAVADGATVDVATEDVGSADNQVTVTVALPAEVVGKRVERAVLEVPIAIGAGADSLFIAFPLLELYEDGSEEPKQTLLVAKDFSGVARFDVTRFVRGWSTTDARQFVLGAVSESNATAVELGTPSGWPAGVKARLTIAYSDRDGASVAVDAQ